MVAKTVMRIELHPGKKTTILHVLFDEEVKHEVIFQNQTDATNTRQLIMAIIDTLVALNFLALEPPYYP